MNAQYNPGRWEAVANIVRTVRDANGGGGFLVAECPPSVGNRLEDARLIAAAPDLLAALKALVALSDEVDPDRLFEGEIHRQARAAIAKATGSN
jgi:hypothetical protein